jgi:hypothetical protein
MALLLEAMRLVDADTGEELVLYPAIGNGNAIKVVDFDPGFPGVRSVRVPNPGWPGESDYTSLYGAKAIALVLRLDPTASAPVMSTLSSLRAWANPARTVRLFYTPAGGVERVLYLKGDQLGSPLPRDALLFGAVDVQVQWVVPDGVEYSAATTETAIPLQTVITTGRPYPLVYPRTYAVQDGLGVATITNAGTTPSSPIVRIYGPCTGARIENETAGLAVAFAGFVIGGTEYIEIDMARKTVQFRGEPGADANRRSKVTETGWWQLLKGDNIIRFTATSGSSPAQALVLSQDAWI